MGTNKYLPVTVPFFPCLHFQRHWQARVFMSKVIRGEGLLPMGVVNGSGALDLEKLAQCLKDCRVTSVRKYYHIPYMITE